MDDINQSTTPMSYKRIFAILIIAALIISIGFIIAAKNRSRNSVTTPQIVKPSDELLKATETFVVSIKDTDHDGLSDEEEKKRGTDPGVKDTDHDGLIDGFEVEKKFDPKNPKSKDPSLTDLQWLMKQNK
jgi:Bacterial TSP3 repeat